MPRQQFPRYPRKPHATGQARIKVQGRTVYLGIFNSPESHEKYQALYAAWQKGELRPGPDGKLPPATTPAGRRTVADLVAGWLVWAEANEVDAGGVVRGEVVNMKYAFRPLARLHGAEFADAFGARELTGLQGSMARGAWLDEAEKEQLRARGRPIGWCRNVVNRATARVKLLFRWGELHGYVPEGHAGKLALVRGIGEHIHGVRVTDLVPPVAEEVVTASLPHLRPQPRDVVELLLLTGARPGELLRLRPRDLNRTGVVRLARDYEVQLGAGVWAFQPRRHKTKHKGHQRVILFGPKAQAVLAKYLGGRAEGDYLFSPAESVAAWRREQRAARASKVQPSQEDRSKRHPERRPGAHYTTHALTVAVRRAARAAGVAHWHPNQVRHLAATRMVQEFGPAIAMVLLGHRHAQTLSIYALPDLKGAAGAVKDVG